MQRHLGEVDEHIQFWQEYLGNFHGVQECTDYVKLLDHVFHALGSISAGQSLLDVGCGNGNAGKYFLDRVECHLSLFPNTHILPTRYVGIDLVPEALETAKCSLTQDYQKRCNQGSFQSPFIHMSWMQHDLNRPLPFVENRFEKIVSNLVLGYTAAPKQIIKDLYRILTPGGRMVLTNLKPNADFSGIYQSLMEEARDGQCRQQARDLLNNYGKIRQAEKEGKFTFFDENKWIKILKGLPEARTNIFPTFSQQGLLIIVEKPVSASQMQPVQSNTTLSCIHVSSKKDADHLAA